MARIPEEEIKRLRREVSLERLAEAFGVKLKRHGADLLGLCPFHEDHSPSLVISPQKNLWNCLGFCGKGGSVIDWVMRAEGVSFRHAVELLKQEHLPLAAKQPGPPPKKSTTVKLTPLAERTIDDKRLLENVNSAGSVVARYAQGLSIDEPFAMLRSGATSYYEQHGLGSVTSLSSGAGALAQTYTFDSFGEQTGSAGSLTNPFQYTGRELDSESSLSYMRARYFDPSTGRFISEDPLGFDSGGGNFQRTQRTTQ